MIQHCMVLMSNKLMDSVFPLRGWGGGIATYPRELEGMSEGGKIANLKYIL